MRTVFLMAALLGFVGLGVLDLIEGHPKTGTAALLLAGANYLLLVA